MAASYLDTEGDTLCRTVEDLYIDLYGRFDASGSLDHLHALAAEVEGEQPSEP